MLSNFLYIHCWIDASYLIVIGELVDRVVAAFVKTQPWRYRWVRLSHQNLKTRRHWICSETALLLRIHFILLPSILTANSDLHGMPKDRLTRSQAREGLTMLPAAQIPNSTRIHQQDLRLQLNHRPIIVSTRERIAEMLRWQWIFKLRFASHWEDAARVARGQAISKHHLEPVPEICPENDQRRTWPILEDWLQIINVSVEYNMRSQGVRKSTLIEPSPFQQGGRVGGMHCYHPRCRQTLAKPFPPLATPCLDNQVWSSLLWVTVTTTTKISNGVK